MAMACLMTRRFNLERFMVTLKQFVTVRAGLRFSMLVGSDSAGRLPGIVGSGPHLAYPVFRLPRPSTPDPRPPYDLPTL